MELEKQSIVGCLAEDFNFSSWMAHNKPNGLSYAVLHIFCSVNNLHSLRERNLKHFSDAFDRSALKNIIRINTYCCKFAKQRSQYRHIIIDATQQNRLISQMHSCLSKRLDCKRGIICHFTRMVKLRYNIDRFLDGAADKNIKQFVVIINTLWQHHRNTRTEPDKIKRFNLA